MEEQKASKKRMERNENKFAQVIRDDGDERKGER